MLLIRIITQIPKLIRIEIFLLLVLCSACGVQKNTTKDSGDFKGIQELVRSGSFQIEHGWVNTMRGNNINLIGNSNYIKFKNDSVSIYLPYFGVREAGGNYGGIGDGAISYQGKPEKLKIKEFPDKNKIELNFECQKETETFQFFVTLYGSLSANTSLNSSNLEGISYRGNVSAIPEKE